MNFPTSTTGLLELSASLAAMGSTVTRDTSCQFCAPGAPCPFHITFTDRQSANSRKTTAEEPRPCPSHRVTSSQGSTSRDVMQRALHAPGAGHSNSQGGV